MIHNKKQHEKAGRIYFPPAEIVMCLLPNETDRVPVDHISNFVKRHFVYRLSKRVFHYLIGENDSALLC